ncbi:hypothetical protein [Halobellus ordinarius]|uniref:hypothetical protein n=1 Tax=Halobellus ordinarius TaxID=3075120 RepID=UPI0028805577|nr:hypothetical protein [Halobellus sp. ZY16]
MTYGSHIVNKQSYYKERFKEANTRLQQYPSLQSVFGSLSWQSDKTLQENPIILQLSRERRRGDDVAWLSTVEDAIDSATSKLSSSDIQDLHSELCSPDGNKVMSRVTELVCYQYFSSQGPSVMPEPSLSVNRNTDLRVDDTCPVYIEITRLGTAKTERAIEDVYQSAAEEISKQLPRNKYLRLDINTTELDWSGSPLDKKGSKWEILNQVQRTHLLKLLQHRDALRLRDIQSMPSDWTLQKIIEDAVKFGTHGTFGQNWNGILNKPQFSRPLQTQAKEFEGPIVSALMGDAKSGLVELHSEMHSPSSAATHQEERFLRRVREHKLEDKIKKAQREPSEANLLMISATHWLARGYTESNDQPLGRGQQEKIKDEIQETLKQYSIPELVGVIMMEDGPSKSLWIENPNADSNLVNDYKGTHIYQHMS